MLYGLDISPAGPWGRPDHIAELAALAEGSGWHGIFCEDYVCFPGDEGPVDSYDVWITLALVAKATQQVTLGTMVTPLPRRRPWVVASQALTVDHLSGGRLVLGVGIGDGQSRDYATFGEPMEPRQRATMLDEALEIISRLWAGESVSLQGEHYDLEGAELRPQPVKGVRIPIWVGGALTKPRPKRRALRWDGACLYRIPPESGWEDVTPDDVRRLRAEADQRSGGGDGYVIAVGGRERSADVDADRHYVQALAEAGADWWHEYVPPRLSFDEARSRIASGPVMAAST